MGIDERSGDDWILTASGRQFWPLRPRAADLDIRDIAHSLSLKCRWGGHCSEFYSVAQHSVLCAWACPEAPGWALLHDAAEAYLADVCRPLKAVLSGFSEAEDRILGCVAERWGLSGSLPDCVRVADDRLLVTEAARLMPEFISAPWLPRGVEPFPLTVVPWSPERARRTFLAEFGVLFPRFKTEIE